MRIKKFETGKHGKDIPAIFTAAKTMQRFQLKQIFIFYCNYKQLP